MACLSTCAARNLDGTGHLIDEFRIFAFPFREKGSQSGSIIRYPKASNPRVRLLSPDNKFPRAMK